MPLKKPRLEQSPRRILTAHAGLALIGEAIAASRLDQAVKSMGSYRGTDHGQVLSTYLGLLTLGKSDFEAAEGVRKDPFFLSCMGLKRGLSAARLRQRMDASAMDIDFIIKWNPRQASAADWLAHADGLEASKVKWEAPREGKRIATFSVNETRSWQGQEYTFRRVMRVVERTIDRKGQALVFPDLEVEGWWTSLELSDDDIIALYRGHATCEQFHSEFKTDMDLERLPSGKFDTNTLVMAAGTFVYNVLRWIGLQGLIGDDSPVRHPAKRRRIRTVFQELISLPAQLVHHARQVWLRFGAHCLAHRRRGYPWLRPRESPPNVAWKGSNFMDKRLQVP
ncbi:Transposase DDE domain group 1 [Ectothiorhodospira magna]|uniref:Transposase DDE domain group 1 n=1 Tax=Ectothiorhodospira magna TaxID=867345 RepID=A0A1H9EBY6_9GAMM|nr:transposase [Ectothiorhodospira magna]SEQ23286.1 Transposase DDE domain group 1 [Ectothiorhodospira magna]